MHYLGICGYVERLCNVGQCQGSALREDGQDVSKLVSEQSALRINYMNVRCS